jgi:hypothetical protein
MQQGCVEHTAVLIWMGFNIIFFFFFKCFMFNFNHFSYFFFSECSNFNWCILIGNKCENKCTQDRNSECSDGFQPLIIIYLVFVFCRLYY